MEKANLFNSQDEFLRYFNIGDKKEISNNKLIKAIHDKYNLVWADLYKFTSWGKIKNRYVLIDYGYTLEVCRKYYGRKKISRNK